MHITNSLWEGVYNSFEEAGGDLDAFETDLWIEKQKSKILHDYTNYENGNLALSKDYPLPLVVSMLLSQRAETSVLDFGGGMGTQYLQILAQVPQAKEKLKYFIIDGKATIENIPFQLIKHENLIFSTSLETTIERVDIVHLGSTLHYIENWKELLRFLTQKYQPKYFVFSDLLAGDIPTFVSHQIFYEMKIPVWMINVAEFIELMKVLNFHNTYSSFFQANILGKEDFPNFSLPKNNRIQKSLNMIFQENKSFDAY